MTPMVPGLVSTVIPVYNRPDLLVEAVESVLSQTYRPIEVIVVDDGSTDTTLQVARFLADKNSGTVHLIQQNNAGPGLARQAGFEASKGEFIQYLDSDDVLRPRKFEVQVAALKSAPECGTAYGKTSLRKVGQRQSNVPFKRTGERIETIFPAALKGRWWSTSTPLHRRTVLCSVGPWTHLRNEEDYEYDCRIAALGIRLAYCDTFVSDTRYHDGSQLSKEGSSDPAKLNDRAQARRLIYSHARRAGISDETPEMQYFAREVFLLARQCGAAGLIDGAKMLFGLAREASGTRRAKGLDFQLYDIAARVLGWRVAGRLSYNLDRIRAFRS